MLSEALMSLQGQFEGDYYPLESSTSYRAIPTGMSQEDAKTMEANGLLFKAVKVAGKGVFTNSSKDIAALINAGAHLQLIAKVKQGGEAEARTRLQMLQSVVRDDIKQSGYDLVERP